MDQTGKPFVVAAAILLTLATLLGALGAHALQGRLSPSQLESYEVAVRYQFFHSLGLLVVGMTLRSTSSGLLTGSAWALLGGIVLFSGSIYVLCFGAPRMLGFVTPLGGLALIAGWLLFAVGYWRDQSRS
jgi:uncharacterized membrane protein YgdD (TMEM256/DUF423 family)